MVRYIEEYKMKDNRWYDIVKGSITTDHPAFQFVSSEFNGVAEKLVGISRRSGVNGSAVSAENLLRLIDGALAKNTGLDVSTLTSNRQIYSI